MATRDDWPEFWANPADPNSLDLGHQHKLSLVEDQEGRVIGFTDWHPYAPDPSRECGGAVALEGEWWVKDQPGRGWRMTSQHPLTLEPSLLCRTCGDHGFVRNGRWEPA